MLLYFYKGLPLGLWNKKVEKHIGWECNWSKEPVGSMLTKEGLQHGEYLGYDEDGQSANANRETCKYILDFTITSLINSSLVLPESTL